MATCIPQVDGLSTEPRVLGRHKNITNYLCFLIVHFSYSYHTSVSLYRSHNRTEYF